MACLQIKAEWGEFEAIHAFGVFSLKPKLSLSTVREKLDKLVTVFGSTTRSQNAVDRLLHQFLDYQAYASKQRPLADISFSLPVVGSSEALNQT